MNPVLVFPKKKKAHKGGQKIRNIAVLTSGGDAPGMNAAIRSVVRSGIAAGYGVFGIERGYSGILEDEMKRMSAKSVANILHRGGTILKTDRSLEFYQKKARATAARILREHAIDALVVIGGDGSFRGAHALQKETGMLTIGVPGTIDNDIQGTDYTIGFDTAVNTAVEAIDRIRDTANSHDRIFLVEVMGRSSGHIAVHVGLSGGAETLVIPEMPQSTASIVKTIQRGIARGKSSSIIVVAEGQRPGEKAQTIAKSLKKSRYDSKICILGHIQRGGAPTATDRVTAACMGYSAVKHLELGYSDGMIATHHEHVEFVPFGASESRQKRAPRDLADLTTLLAI